MTFLTKGCIYLEVVWWQVWLLDRCHKILLGKRRIELNCMCLFSISLFSCRFHNCRRLWVINMKVNWWQHQSFHGIIIPIRRRFLFISLWISILFKFVKRQFSGKLYYGVIVLHHKKDEARNISSQSYLSNSVLSDILHLNVANFYYSTIIFGAHSFK